MIETYKKKFCLRAPYSKSLISTLKSIDGKKWNPTNRTWGYPASPASAYAIDTTLRADNYQYIADEGFREALERFKALSNVIQEDNNDPPEIPKYKTKPFKHQREAFWRMAKIFGDNP